MSSTTKFHRQFEVGHYQASFVDPTWQAVEEAKFSSSLCLHGVCWISMLPRKNIEILLACQPTIAVPPHQTARKEPS
jgi:hypothetical protein